MHSNRDLLKFAQAKGKRMVTALCVAQTDADLDAAMDEGVLQTSVQMDDEEEHVVSMIEGQSHVPEEDVPSVRCALA